MEKLCSTCGELKLRSEFYSRESKCKPCVKKNRAAYYKINAEEIKLRAIEWKKENPLLVKKYQAINYQRHKPRWKMRKVKRTAARRLEDLRRQKRSPEKYAAASARRRAYKLGATPAWANRFFIEEAYDLARRRTKMLGFPWHVDHIVPLRSNIVCGLHVEHNLQVIPGIDNCRKNNIHWPGMP